MTKKYFPALIAILLTFTIYSQEVPKEIPKWDVANPGTTFNYKTHNFSTDEGTWMNLDVSPDGKTIIFDMLGDIYSLPFPVEKQQCFAQEFPMKCSHVSVSTENLFPSQAMPAEATIFG